MSTPDPYEYGIQALVDLLQRDRWIGEGDPPAEIVSLWRAQARYYVSTFEAAKLEATVAKKYGLSLEDVDALARVQSGEAS